MKQDEVTDEKQTNLSAGLKQIYNGSYVLHYCSSLKCIFFVIYGAQMHNT